eukprot:scaffold70586_cov78-Phaeocystis_antarctica.AAC.1
MQAAWSDCPRRSRSGRYASLSGRCESRSGRCELAEELAARDWTVRLAAQPTRLAVQAPGRRHAA